MRITLSIRDRPLAAMRCGIELSTDEILGEPDDQVVIHGHLHAFAERPLAPAGAPSVGDISAPSVDQLSRAVLVEQADGDAQRGDAAIAGELLGRVHQQCRDALPLGQGDPQSCLSWSLGGLEAEDGQEQVVVVFDLADGGGDLAVSGLADQPDHEVTEGGHDAGPARSAPGSNPHGM